MSRLESSAHNAAEKNTDGNKRKKKRIGSALEPFLRSLSAWIDILTRTYKNSVKHNIVLMSAGVAFFTFLSIVPFIVAAISIYGIFFKSSDVYDYIRTFLPLLPSAASEIIRDQLFDLSTQKTGVLGWSTFVSLIITVWSSGTGVSALITAINAAYKEKETRIYLKLRLIAVTITLGFFIIGILNFAIIAAVPPLFDKMGLSWLTQSLLSLGRWPAMFAIVCIWLTFLYQYGPDRKHVKWRRVSAGAILATLLWIAVSFGFSAYIEHIAHLNTTYGSLAGVIILQIWLFLTALSVILGAEINAEIEHQYESKK